MILIQAKILSISFDYLIVFVDFVISFSLIIIHMEYIIQIKLGLIEYFAYYYRYRNNLN